MEKKIYIKDWLILKPYEKQTITDSYYLKISNEVKKAIISNKQSFVFQRYIDVEEINILACFLTSYFEDLVSETNIWKSFVQLHHRLYKKQLPFYSNDDYYEDEVNMQDVSFLIWYFINTIQEEKFIAPYNDFITESAKKVIEIFDKEWEYAPENKYLKTFYQIDASEENYYEARKLIDRILFKTYLLYPDTTIKLEDKEIEIILENNQDKNLHLFLNENRDNTINNTHTHLLSLTGKEWTAEILGKGHRLNAAYLNISKKIQGYFFYKGQDKENIFIEHIASGKKFEITKKSIDFSNSLKEIDSILFMGIARWNNEWWFSGVFFQQEFNPDLVLDEKNSLQSRLAVNFLDYQSNETDKLINKQLQAFKDFNNGSQIAFLPSDSVNEFCKKYVEFYNNSLHLSEKENEEANQRAKNEGFFGSNDKQIDFSKISDTVLVFFNPKSGTEIALGVNSAFPISSNPYFKEEESEDHVLKILMDESFSTELAMYCIDNCKNKLLFFKEGIGKKYLDDIDFLLRFWKKEIYHATPSFTYIGQKK